MRVIVLYDGLLYCPSACLIVNQMEFLMTEIEIKKSINKHFLKPLIVLAILFVLLEFVNAYFFEGEPVSNILIFVFSMSGCTYVFRKVLVDLLVVQNEKNSIEE